MDADGDTFSLKEPHPPILQRLYRGVEPVMVLATQILGMDLAFGFDR